uniref:NET domain-containing protein n=1 Tax=viral metagenome TaxID=1070528 RepID=A0A6C0HE72_9ZZZZ
MAVQEVDINELSLIRDKIEGMTKFNQVEVLRILNKHQNVTLNENKYGVHINLTDLSSEIINELKIYINYVNTQEINLNNIEQQKENFKSIYFAKDNKDNNTKNNKYAISA